MPLYEFICSHCGHRFEEISTISARDQVRCPKCGQLPERLYEGKSGFGVGAVKSAPEAGCGGCCAQCPHHAHG